MSRLRAEVRAEVRSTMTAMRDPVLAIWMLYLILVPVYAYKSGLPQPGDWLILFIVPMVLRSWNGKLSTGMIATLRPLIVFTAYTVLENLVWSVLLGAFALGLKNGFGLSPLFYIYNALIFLAVLVMYRRYGSRLFWFTGNAILIALALQVVVAVGFAGGAARATLLFNNPNQLGYFALLSLNILFLLHRRGFVGTIAITIGSVAASYLALISASKAALGGIAILAVVGSVIRLRTLLVVAATFGILFAVAEPLQDAVNQTIARYESEVGTSFIEERGYDRIGRYPEYWLLGSGEGGYYRYADDSALGSHEIHSSAGTLFFCYGLVGTLLFALFLWGNLRGTGFRTWLMISPSIAYGMTHQGLRTTPFWVLLAMVVAMRDEFPRRR